MRAAAALLLALAACGKAPSAGCPQDPSFDRSGLVKVRLVMPPAAVRRDLDLAGIDRLSGGDNPQGLTTVDHSTDIGLRLRRETGRGRACAWLESVEIDLSPRSIAIYVPREYPEGTCEDAAILAHEREHERVHREKLEEAAAKVRTALAAASWLPAKGNPIVSPDQLETEAALDAKVREVLLPLIGDYEEGLKAAQAELDTPALYHWTTERCSGWK